MTRLEQNAVDSMEVGALFRRYVVMVRGRALRILGNLALAEEVAQEAFVKYLQLTRAGGQVENPGGLLYRIVTNLALNLMRDARRRSELLKEVGMDTRCDGRLSPEDLLTLRQIFAKVPEEEARIASYYYMDGMDQDEIAALLSMQRRTVGRRLDKFRKQARRFLEKSEQSGGI